MKILTLTLSVFFILTSVYAQKIEFSVQANSGMFSYAGRSAVSNALIHQSPQQVPNFTDNPYGDKSGFGYGGSFQAQAVCKSGFIAGLQAGYELLKSKVNINQVLPQYNIEFDYLPNENFTSPPPLAAKGETYLKNEFINVSPYIGYRINLEKLRLDLMPGVEWGFGLNTHEQGAATTTDGNNINVQTDLKRDKAPVDMRLKFGAAVIYNRFAINASYAHGVTNYQANLIGVTDFEVHSNVLRFGLS